MIVAGLAGMLLTLALLRSADRRVEVAVAAHDVRAGSIVGPGDIRTERVKMDDDLLDTVLRPDEVAELDGAVATETIRAGELVARSDVRSPAASSGLRAVSIPIERARAVNGELVPGDRVDVLLAAEREVAIIVANAEVLDVSDPDAGGALGDVDRQFTITLAVDVTEAQLLTAAITDGDILIARATGAESAEGTPPLPIDFVEGGTG
ncbi:MAG TPA: RcpC/CpaB family pilus assembly protein [Acidimicrobiia bacterium]|nr:RcpC/CpaB family pilus assembly protein [Acidimicrobiia bacterium]